MSTKKEARLLSARDLFESLKRDVAILDSVSFAEQYLTIDGKPFNLSGGGWRYMAEIYRTISAQVENKAARPVILLKGRQVGATILAGVLSLHLAASGLYSLESDRSPIRVMHVFPDLKRCGVYAKDTLSTLISGSKDGYAAKRGLKAAKTSDLEDTQTQKNFMGMSKIRVDSIGKNGDRIRGSTYDVIFFDECQDMVRTAIESTLRILTSTPYGAPTQGVQVYFGTPKHTGSYFWGLWEESDKRFYFLRCTGCQEYFQLYNLDNEDWNQIWVEKQTVACPHCSRKQDKRDAVDGGKWVATRPLDSQGRPAKYIGFHFNMMLSPLYTKENVLAYWPGHNKDASERAWRNETKGQFYSASEAPLTIEDIYAKCLDENRGLAKSVRPSSGKMYFLGMDWGEKVESAADMDAKRGKSYTCAVILGVDHNGVMTVENAVRLEKNDLDYKVNVVRKLMSDFNIEQAAADRYYANDLVPLLQSSEGYGEKFLGCTNLGNAKRVFAYNKKMIDVGINKDLCLEEIFAAFKAGRIKLPAAGDSLEILSWLIQHITSMETHVKVKDGIVLKSYQKGTIQNDGLMALMYAYTAYKFRVTNGFDVAAGTKNVKEQDQAIKPVLGHIPRMK